MAARLRQGSSADNQEKVIHPTPCLQFNAAGQWFDMKILLLVFLAAINLVPIWSVKFVPGLDLPNHLLSATLHTLPSTDLRMEYFHAQWLPSPYMLFSLLMFPPLQFFGHLTALKIALSLAIVGIPLSALFFMRVFNPRNWE